MRLFALPVFAIMKSRCSYDELTKSAMKKREKAER